MFACASVETAGELVKKQFKDFFKEKEEETDVRIRRTKPKQISMRY